MADDSAEATLTWELWYPEAAAAGLSFARCRVAASRSDHVLVHAAPPKLEVVVRDEAGRQVAAGEGLERGEKGPMCALVRDGDRVRLVDGWPAESDLGRLVLLPGGEAGVLTAWWHADDQSEWRWSVEFYNHV